MTTNTKQPLKRIRTRQKYFNPKFKKKYTLIKIRIISFNKIKLKTKTNKIHPIGQKNKKKIQNTKPRLKWKGMRRNHKIESRSNLD